MSEAECGGEEERGGVIARLRWDCGIIALGWNRWMRLDELADGRMRWEGSARFPGAPQQPLRRPPAAPALGPDALAALHAQVVSVLNIKALVPITLDVAAANFTRWRGLFLVALSKYALTDHVLSDDHRPDLAKWFQMDCVVLAWLYGSISADLLQEVMSHDATACSVTVPARPGQAGWPSPANPWAGTIHVWPGPAGRGMLGPRPVGAPFAGAILNGPPVGPVGMAPIAYQATFPTNLPQAGVGSALQTQPSTPHGSA
ncbi:hypothetical protein OsJ_09779 [Oryza sativa Japonica Group]|uniref:Retrotransposon protein, putative, unclassified n=1 Tax=Oryza sativa subsp. japonica TaxID=39947 RepID=B9F5Q3_ORYSJ|nr:hypothetical protein OsJ_09779 [Oryza sativa Japonica Group]